MKDVNRAKKILIVDDEEKILLILRKHLESLGYIVVSAKDGIQALDKLNPDIDLVLLDYQMPGMDGLEVTRQIKKSEQFANLPIIFVSAYTERKDRINAVEAGADDFAAKPLDLLEIQKRVEVHLQKKEAQDALKQQQQNIEETLLKRTKELQESEKRLRLITENVPAIILQIDQDRTITYASHPPIGITHKEVIGSNFEKWFKPEFEKELKATIKHVFSTGESRDCEATGTSTERNYTFRFNPVQHDGLIENAVIIALDITERKRAEEKLSYQANVLSNVSDAIISTDSNLQIKSWNPAAERIYGWKENEVIGKSIDEVCQTEFVDISQEEAQTILLKEKSWTSELLQKNREGKIINVLASVSLLKDNEGNIISGITVNHDITERKQAEEALRESESRYAQLAEQSRTVTWEVDAEGLFTYISPVAEKIFGIRMEEIVGKLHFFDLHPEEGQEEFKMAVLVLHST
ncbi:MAG: PAS domain S-box protein [Candidatus Electryonea clarkiae]|nr:PAS domain S-box protein [Candidatus Electryonea clarkiae]MDP8285177.1 PAS domain S-box protein [Candidatus Electryonea clarkiae]